MSDDFADWATSRDTIEATITRSDGDDITLEVVDATVDDVRELDRRREAAETEAEAVAVADWAIEEFVVADVDPDQIPVRKRRLILLALREAWAASDAIAEAADQMPIDQGN